MTEIKKYFRMRLGKLFDKIKARLWDRQLKLDVMQGKLDGLATQAISDFRAGKFKEL